MSCFKNFCLPAQRKGNLLFLPSGDELQGKGPLFSGPGRQNVILTMGRSGCYWDDGIHQVHFPAAPLRRWTPPERRTPLRQPLPSCSPRTWIWRRRSAALPLPPDFPPPSRGFPIPFIDRSTLEFYMGRECGEGETSPAHPGQFKKSAHSANQGVRSL